MPKTKQNKPQTIPNLNCVAVSKEEQAGKLVKKFGKSSVHTKMRLMVCVPILAYLKNDRRLRRSACCQIIYECPTMCPCNGGGTTTVSKELEHQKCSIAPWQSFGGWIKLPFMSNNPAGRSPGTDQSLQ